MTQNPEPKNLRSRKVFDLLSQHFIFQIRMPSATKAEMQDSKKQGGQI